ncbi:uncharacterized protein DEA37_0007952 [Paragonimus westermani]|uniref:PRKR-interacting protein 1 n=1 Tax=Paragonimus westermani TaxID=34504 RepID=A0A5J4NTL7_9TREM|nr:uncharacterized protein DEA37_0007952 [Paragonimus westermani]
MLSRLRISFEMCGVKLFSVSDRSSTGSAAGVGSGDFHIYRGIRRREYARLESIENAAEEERLNREFQEKQRMLDEISAAKTAKKRQKRQKKKSKRVDKTGKIKSDESHTP